MADTRLILGGISFRDFEVPEKINFGMRHHIEMHRLVGGRRVIDAMGQDPDPIKWRGRFRGADAAARARRCETLAASGREVSLSWGGFAYLVIVVGFEAEYEKFYEIPYTITCEVSQTAGGMLFSSLSALISADVSSLVSIARSL